MFGTVGDPDYVPMSVLYNHTVLVVSRGTDLGKVETSPLEIDEELVLGNRYMSRCNQIVKMTKEIPKDGQEYFLGYRFWGDNHLIYFGTGQTMGPDYPTHDDIVSKVIE